MLLHLSTWPEVETYLEQSRGIIIPIGSTEQHGPTGLIGTDAICAEAVARGVGEATTALVAPTLNVGMALHHTEFPGTISLRPTTLITVLEDYLICLAKAGFTRFFFINGHGGNIATLKAAFAQFYYRCSELNLTHAAEIRCHLANWFMCRSVYKLAQELYGKEEGSHATPSEVALTQFVYPEAIKTAPLSPEVASGFPIYSAADFRRSYPDGRMGSNPDLATPEHGKQFYELAVQELSESYRKFVGEERDS
ncbi:creatininase family protein [Oscillatoria sp. FACHB-1406]|uniref:creatininase family protein n=1 Tax=Oscillatoria sp. FACHB-1406 TaxID=2692846 RepID=UPI0016864DB6|nr:creatininase family protein [Oscillatoria sp. FACHB-1406]MBD2578868.1 creatininase family protein [Oscillatoria sp. FACHB-1406]